MNRSIEKLAVMICAVIFFSVCASYAQSEYWEGSGYEGTVSDSNENAWQTSNSNGYEPVPSVVVDSWGSPTPAEISEPNEGAYFPSSVSESSSTLVDETTSYQYGRANVAGDSAAPSQYSPSYAMGFPSIGNSKNIFWIVSKDGTMHWSSVSIPCRRYARMLIIPSSSGQLIMEERYPTGQVRSYNFGNVRAYNQYRMWFFADTSGTHQLRYRIDNGPYSNILTFHVGNCGVPPQKICPCCGQLINR